MSEVSLLPSVKTLAEACHSGITNTSEYLNEVSGLCSGTNQTAHELLAKLSSTHSTVDLIRKEISSQAVLLRDSIKV